MIAYIFKQNGLYKVLSQQGWLLGVYSFHNDNKAKELLSGWLQKDGYHTEYIRAYWEDSRIKEAILNYEGNYPGITWGGHCN